MNSKNKHDILKYYVKIKGKENAPGSAKPVLLQYCLVEPKV